MAASLLGLASLVEIQVIFEHLVIYEAVPLTGVWLLALFWWLREARLARLKHALELEMWLKVGGDMRMISKPPTDPRILFVGSGFIQVTGWEPLEMINHRWTSFVHPDDLILASQFLSQVSKNNEVPVLTLRWWHRQRDRWVWLEWRSIYVEELGVCYLNARDMTHEFDREAAAAAWSRITSDLIAVADTAEPTFQRKFEWVNDAWARQLGWDADEIREMRILDLLDIKEIHPLLWKDPLKDESEREALYECRVLCKSPPGQGPVYRLFEWRSLQLNGKLYFTGRNIEAERVHQEEITKVISDLKARNEDLERFTSVAAHQLRSPPRTIAGIASALREDYETLLDDQGKEFLEDIQKDADQMAEIVDGLYRFSKVRTSEDLKIEPVEIGTLINLAKERWARKFAQTHPAGLPTSQFHRVIVTGELPTVLGDPLLLREVFKELIDNSFKFNESQFPEVWIRAERRPDQRWDIKMTDNGIGIPKQYQAKLFKMFQRVHPQYNGTGVGLALVAAIINKFGGTITVESEENKGTTFTFDLSGAWDE